MPLISVVIPTYNSSSLLCEAIDSVLSQTFHDYEIIIVDDGSTDNTSDVIRNYGNIVQYHKLNHRGASIARSFGIAQSQGQYIATLDADDIWLPDKLKLQVEIMESNQRVCLCYTDGYRWLSGSSLLSSPKLSEIYGRGKSGWQFDFMFKTTAAATSSMVFRRTAYEICGGYDTELRYCDAEFLIRMAAQFPFEYVHRPLMAYRVHATNTSSKITRNNAASNLRFLYSIRVKAITQVQPNIGDFTIYLFRHGPTLLQWALLLFWRLRYTSRQHTLDRLYRYGSALLLRANNTRN